MDGKAAHETSLTSEELLEVGDDYRTRAIFLGYGH